MNRSKASRRPRPKKVEPVGGPFDNASTTAEMEDLCIRATLEELSSTFDRLVSGEFQQIQRNPWHGMGAKICIKRELERRFEAWCRTAAENIGISEVLKVAQAHRFEPDLWPGARFDGVRGRSRVRNAVQAAEYAEARAAWHEAKKQRHFDSKTDYLRQRLHDPKMWPYIAITRPWLADELGKEERTKFDAVVAAADRERARDEHRHNIAIMPRAGESK
jgi:hypothetical protein